MALISQAAPMELSSPVYQTNKEICLKYEKLLLQHGGSIEGGYSAWAYKISGHFKTQLAWNLTISKSTYSMTGAASRNEWNVYEEFKLRTNISNTNTPEFIIRKRNFFDRFKSNTFTVSRNTAYVIIGASEKFDLPHMAIDLFSTPINRNKLHEITFKNQVLEVTIPFYDEGYSFISELIKN